MTQTTSLPAPVQLAQAYFDAWNAHDGPAVLATFDPAGTYVDPTLPGPIGREHLVGYVAGLAAAFPDLHFEIDDVVAAADRVIAQWRMRGTHTGPLSGAPRPTGGSCDLPGIDVITVGDGGIASVVGYFDQKTFVEQLGLRTLVVPADAASFTWGTAIRTDFGNPTVPGALSMTWTEPASKAEMREVEDRTRSILEGLAGEPGFIAWLGTTTGARMHTVTAWTSPAAAEAAMARNAPHREAVARVRRDGILPRGFTSIWVPYRLNQQMADCPACGVKVWFDAEANPRCSCGAEINVASYL
jgi:steroid delta-isomerase-like uncharacterized protein